MAKLSKRIRKIINRLLKEGRSPEEIVLHLGEAGHELSVEQVTAWKEGGYREWAKTLDRLQALRRMREFACKVTRANPGAELQEAALQLAAAQVCELLAHFDAGILKSHLAENPSLYTHLLNSLARLSDGGLKYERYRAEVAERKEAMKKELETARQEGGLTLETVEKIERELNLL